VAKRASIRWLLKATPPKLFRKVNSASDFNENLENGYIDKICEYNKSGLLSTL